MNSWLKTVITAFSAAVVPIVATVVDSVVTSTPTGGLATYLAAHPIYALAGGLIALQVHNYISVHYPPATVVHESQLVPNTQIAQMVGGSVVVPKAVDPSVATGIQ